MIQISQLKLQIPHTEEQLEEKIKKVLGIRKTDLLSFRILKRSLDARKKPVLFYVYTVEAEVKREKAMKHKIKNPNVLFRGPIADYKIIPCGEQSLRERPVIIGSGPAGLFCTYALAKMGYRPLLLERGEAVDVRVKDVEDFWKNGKLKSNSNVQFGEGGAGTFSDGKLNTLVHDKEGRGREVLEVFVKHGAPEQILYDNKPHIGTDILVDVVKNMRASIEKSGGEVRFHTKVSAVNFEEKDGEKALVSLEIQDTHTNEISVIPTELAVLAIGHSARDTFRMLHEKEIPMEAKSFAVGVRAEHLQTMIDESQYGSARKNSLPAAAYKLTAKLENGRGVYTFCMCPGGYVVNASSEEGRIAVNGMSYSGRDGKNANSAVIVTVTPEDFGTEDVLAGVAFQQKLEEAAYHAGNGKIPVQLFGDFCQNKASSGAGAILPQIKGDITWTNIRQIFPEVIADALEQGILMFDRKLKGYADPDTVLSAVESRTSSPVRILRDQNMQSVVRGLYPCGEGAGYAGGITSASMDGLKVAESVSQKYAPFDKGLTY